MSFAPAQSKSRVASVASGPASAPVNPFLDADRTFTFGEDALRDKQALALIERSVAADGGNYQWLWRAARACYYVGEDAAKAEKLRYFERGRDYALRAVALQTNAVEGHFWLGVNYGGLADVKGVFQAFQLIKKIRAEMETVLRLNDSYNDAGAYHALGEMDRQLPRLLGGNLSRAITRLEQGARLAPHNLELKLALAKAYQDAGRKADADRCLQEIVQRRVNPSHAGAERHVQEKAQKMLGK